MNKLDYAASAHEKAEIEGDRKLPRTIKNRFQNLLPAQQFMSEHKNENLIVIAPTGSGKTEAGLLWIGEEKGFYTLPLKVSSNDIFDRIHDTYEYTLAGLLHSGSIYQYLDKSSQNEEIDALAEYREVKRLSRPLTVCTVDQLFKFVFKAIGTEIFAATLKYSKIVIDEMQMYEPRIIAMLIYGVKMITDMGGKFAIITATLPPFIPEIMRENGISFGQQSFLQVKNSCRHIVSFTQEDFDFEKIAHDAKTKKVLVLCNTVKKAQEVKEKLPSAHLLHARFIEKHRRILEKDIIAFARGKENGIWISTQIVEASLDIDFDVLYTEMCSADSLLQRLGRCFRSRNYTGNKPNIYVYNNGNEFHIYDEVIFERSVEFLNKYCGRIFSEEEKQDYINAVFEKKAIIQSDYFKTILEFIQRFKDLPINSYSKEEAGKLFRNINSYRVIPENIYQSYREDIERQIDIMSNKRNEIKVKLQAQKELDDLTVAIGVGTADARFKDIQPIHGTGIYRTTAVYEFDEQARGGRGLLREEAAGSLWL